MTPSESSLLELMIARLTTQRDLLARAADLITDVGGPVLEVGLGKGRTFDHLRRLFPSRRVLAFDRELHALAAGMPASGDFYLGEFTKTLPALDIGRTAALAHVDFGSPDREHDRRVGMVIAPLVQALVRPGGIVLSDRELGAEGWSRLPVLPPPAWSYFMWRVEA